MKWCGVVVDIGKDKNPRRLAFGARAGGVITKKNRKPLRLAFGAREGMVTWNASPTEPAAVTWDATAS